MTQGAQTGGTTGLLAGFSDEMAGAVEGAGATVVRVDARRRIGASGIIWDANGLIVTADHVVEREEDITVGLPDGRELPARVVGRDPGTDLALLRVEASDLPAAVQGPAPKVGNLILALGRPGAGGTMATNGCPSDRGNPQDLLTVTRQGCRNLCRCPPGTEVHRESLQNRE